MVAIGFALAITGIKSAAQADVEIQPGQEYEYLYTPKEGGKSTLFYQTVLEVKEGWVKMKCTAIDGHEFEMTKTEHDFRLSSRLLVDEERGNPFKAKP